MKAAITQTLVNSLPAGPVDIWDTKQPGFVLRVHESGRATWRVSYARGKWYTLGRVSDLTPIEARAEAKKVLGEAAKGNDPGAARKKAKAATLNQYLEDVYGPWLKAHLRSGDKTLAMIKARFGDELGGVKLPNITPWLVEKWRSSRLKKGIKPATINRDLGALKAALRRAVDWGYLDDHPIAKVRPTKVDDNRTPRFLSEAEEIYLREALDRREEEARRARESANQWREERGYPLLQDLRSMPFVDHLKPLVLVAMNTGMRRGELFNLEWPDVDLQRAVLTVKGAGAKSGKTRHIPLNDEALESLKGWKEVNPSRLVFPGREGERMDNIATGWKNLMKAAGIKAFRFHDTRHHFASRLVMAGVDLNTVRELLGHADLKMTLRYAHLAPEHKAAAVAKLTPPKRVSRRGAVA
jgi:integrase